MYKSVKPVKVYYQCDNCKIGFPEIIDSYKEKDDEGEVHDYFVYDRGFRVDRRSTAGIDWGVPSF